MIESIKGDLEKQHRTSTHMECCTNEATSEERKAQHGKKEGNERDRTQYIVPSTTYTRLSCCTVLRLN